jgi:hypothetical protein
MSSTHGDGHNLSCAASNPSIQWQFKRVVVRLPHRRRQVVHFGQRPWIDPSHLHGFFLYYERKYQRLYFQLSGRSARRFRKAPDFGANIGVFTSFLAAFEWTK